MTQPLKRFRLALGALALAWAASGAAAAPACRSALGTKRAQVLVDRCTEVSPATHPPCNAENACDLITDEIDRGCAMLGDDKPAFCNGD